ncbi:hypothetical protein [Draconibacterium sediminis]|uniref:Uncharacterized protein n=1 Tax=Draconibacterium sediminis TaxID=1544798 RepID=A0A0D8JA25_9BACT|nr:hypothetical protein [Draconibacterium sediminis]KJF43835.1 hypothetical protein LH29_12240 [Draconibacterium sediminis]
MKQISKILIVLFLAGCQSKVESVKHENKYDIQILYNHYKKDKTFNRKYLDKEYLRDGNLYLIFESYFNQDTVEVKINGKKEISEIINTESSTGVAKSIKLNDMETINNVGIIVNNGKEAFIEIDTMNFFLITFSDSILKIRVPKSVPFYD